MYQKPRHLLSINDLTGAEISSILERATEFYNKGIRKRTAFTMSEPIAAMLFFQPSTRTQYGFQSTVLRMGGRIINVDQESSRAGTNWGESLSDTARVISGLADVVVIRHPSASGVYQFAESSTIPVVNAGNGMGLLAEHPTQALVDLFSIKNVFGTLDGLKIVIIGGTHLRAFWGSTTSHRSWPSRSGKSMQEHGVRTRTL